jgi:predicted esterase
MSGRGKMQTHRGLSAALGALSLLSAYQVLAQSRTDADAPPQTGAYSVSATSAEAVGPESSAAFASIIPVDEAIEWQIVVPETYDPLRPPGLLVYISPSDHGSLPRQWRELPQLHNVIWVAADDSGNRRQVARRIAYALFAVGLVSRRYTIDSSRIYLSGFTGGARVAGLVAAAYPQIFRGNIYIGGAEIWDREPALEVLERMQKNRYVFAVGTEDSRRNRVLKVAAQYADAGFENIEKMIIPRSGHELLDMRDMSTALNYLDAVLR